MSSQVTWYAARSAGIVAWALATGAVIWGLALSTRAFGKKPRPAWLFDLHRFLGGLTLIFVGIHVGAILLDAYVHFSVINVLIPFTGTWHPAAVAWGIVAFYLLLAVELTSLARAHVSKRSWRRVHFASFVVFATGTVHALTAGTDAVAGPFRIAVAAATAAITALTSLRVWRSINQGSSINQGGSINRRGSINQRGQAQDSGAGVRSGVPSDRSPARAPASVGSVG
jgi:DMSO/TMAO reductase YedYZ heme-binding membrane subunit